MTTLPLFKPTAIPDYNNFKLLLVFVANRSVSTIIAKRCRPATFSLLHIMPPSQSTGTCMSLGSFLSCNGKCLSLPRLLSISSNRCFLALSLFCVRRLWWTVHPSHPYIHSLTSVSIWTSTSFPIVHTNSISKHTSLDSHFSYRCSVYSTFYWKCQNVLKCHSYKTSVQIDHYSSGTIMDRMFPFSP